MQAKNLIALSTSVAASLPATAAIQHTPLNEPLTISSNAIINVRLSEGFADYSLNPAPTPDQFRLAFPFNLSDKPQISATGTGGILATDAESGYAANLQPGHLISEIGKYDSTLSIYVSNATGHQWSPGSQGYLGLMFEENNTPYYGWAEIAYTESEQLVLYQFAYETSGAPIAAGAIPEPKTTALLTALLAGSITIYARRRAKALPA